MDICKINNCNYNKIMRAFKKIQKDYPGSQLGFTLDFFRKDLEQCNVITIKLNQGNYIHCSWSKEYYNDSNAISYEEFMKPKFSLDIE